MNKIMYLISYIVHSVNMWTLLTREVDAIWLLAVISTTFMCIVMSVTVED